MDDLAGLSRRTMLAGLAIAAAPIGAKPAAGEIALIAGGYNHEGGRGLLPLRYQPAGERWQAGTPIADAPDASYAEPGGRFGLLYAVEEGKEGMVSALARRGAGWARVAHLSTRGADPCHLALDRMRQALAVANYSGGSIIVWPLDPRTGLPIGAGELRAHHGHGPNTQRQQAPHAHMVLFTPDNRWLLAVDLGADAMFAYPFEAAGARLGEVKVAYQAKPGSGPRHLALHPRRPRAYLVSELANTVTVLAMEPEARFTELATLPTLPAGFTGQNTAAEIVINAAGTRLYVSNRGHDSVAVYAVDGGGGLAPIEHVSCGGQVPRHLLLLDTAGRLLVSNERSGTINSFRVGADGRLVQASSTPAPGVTYTGVIG